MTPLIEQWEGLEPPADIRDALGAITDILGKRIQEVENPNLGILRSCATIKSRIQESALLVAVTSTASWDAARSAPFTQPDGDALRCLWLVALAWRVASVVDASFDELDAGDRRGLRSVLQSARSLEQALAPGYRIKAEKILREERERSGRSPGPPRFTMSVGHRALHVRRSL